MMEISQLSTDKIGDKEIWIRREFNKVLLNWNWQTGTLAFEVLQISLSMQYSSVEFL